MFDILLFYYFTILYFILEHIGKQIYIINCFIFRNAKEFYLARNCLAMRTCRVLSSVASSGNAHPFFQSKFSYSAHSGS